MDDVLYPTEIYTSLSGVMSFRIMHASRNVSF